MKYDLVLRRNGLRKNDEELVREVIQAKSLKSAESLAKLYLKKLSKVIKYNEDILNFLNAVIISCELDRKMLDDIQ